jgi:hypothetical protein
MPVPEPVPAAQAVYLELVNPEKFVWTPSNICGIGAYLKQRQTPNMVHIS